MKFKNTMYLYHYEVIVNGKSMGQVWKTYRHGYTYWKNELSNKQLFSNRKEAALHLIAAKESEMECEHENNETIPCNGSLETFTICHDCGREL